MATELQLEAFREWFTGKHTYSAEYFQLAHFDIERGFFTANDGYDPSAVDAAWVLRASFDAWQHQQAKIDALKEKQIEAVNQVLSELIQVSENLHNRWHLLSDTADLSKAQGIDQCVSEIKQALRGEHD